MANKFTNFLNDVKLELTKVSWSTREELVNSTIVVLAATAILTFFIYICDVFFSRIVALVMTGL
jgi:preprotein translocase subunit SecE